MLAFAPVARGTPAMPARSKHSPKPQARAKIAPPLEDARWTVQDGDDKVGFARDLVGPRMKLRHSPDSYNFSFMALPLRPELARTVAEFYLADGDWSVAKSRILATNALQCRSSRSSVRMERELRQRLATLTHDQLTLLATATAEDRAAIAWLAALKHIRFAFDFAAEVLRDKLDTQDLVLRYSDYETYVETKSAFHPELAKLRPSSRTKVRQIILGMVTEAGLVGVTGRVMTVARPVLSPPVLRAVLADDPRWLAGFLVPDDEIGVLRCLRP